MSYDALEKKLLFQRGVAKDFPFGPDTAVYKVAGKMFALVAWRENPLRVTLKCDQPRTDFFRITYEAVKPGYYMNKDHWNTVTLDGSVPEDVLSGMIDVSYALVVKGLRKSDREELERQ